MREQFLETDALEALRGELVNESAGYTRFHAWVVGRFFGARAA